MPDVIVGSVVVQSFTTVRIQKRPALECDIGPASSRLSHTLSQADYSHYLFFSCFLMPCNEYFPSLSSLVRMDRTLHTGGCDFTDLLCVSGDVRRSSLVLALWTCRAVSCFAHTIGSFIFTSSIFSLVLLADWWDTPYLDSDHDRPRNASRRVSRFTTLGSINCSPQFMVALGTCGCWLFLFLRS